MRAIHLRALQQLYQQRLREFRAAHNPAKKIRTEPEDAVGKSQLARHIQSGEADVDAIQESDDIQQKQERDADAG